MWTLFLFPNFWHRSRCDGTAISGSNFKWKFFSEKIENVLLTKSPHFSSDWAQNFRVGHENFSDLLTKFELNRMKIVDFLLIAKFLPKKISETNQLTRPNLEFFKNLWQQLLGAKISSKSDFVYSIFSAFEFSQFLSPKMLKWDRELLEPQFWWVTFTFGPK